MSGPSPAETHRHLRLQARSISRPIAASTLLAAEGGPIWRVRAVFERACHLASPGGDVVALVLPEIGDGPLNIVIEGVGLSSAFRGMEPGMATKLAGGRLRIGKLEIALERAEVWEPRPDWDWLRPQRPTIVGRLPLLQDLALEQAPGDSLVALTAKSLQERRVGWQPAPHPPHQGVTQALRAAVSEASTSLRTGWQGDPTKLASGAARLAGLGAGLTPAGDDFLAGVMIAAWLAHPDPHAVCQALLDAAAPRTTILSAAFLGAAADGQCTAAWHRLLDVLARPPGDAAGEGDRSGDPLAAAVQDVLSSGHTSGADMLAGFLSLGPNPCEGSGKPQVCPPSQG